LNTLNQVNIRGIEVNSADKQLLEVNQVSDSFLH
jgi:hypothetical protein